MKGPKKPSRDSRQWQNYLAHSLITQGDEPDCDKWLGWARQKLKFLLESLPGAASQIFTPIPDVQVDIYTRPNRIRIKAGGDVFVTVADNNSIVQPAPLYPNRKGRFIFNSIDLFTDFTYEELFYAGGKLFGLTNSDLRLNIKPGIAHIQNNDWQSGKRALSFALTSAAINSATVVFCIGGKPVSKTFTLPDSSDNTTLADGPKIECACYVDNSADLKAAYPILDDVNSFVFKYVVIAIISKNNRFYRGLFALNTNQFGFVQATDVNVIEIVPPIGALRPALVSGFDVNGKSFLVGNIPYAVITDTKQKIYSIKFDALYSSITSTLVYDKDVDYYSVHQVCVDNVDTTGDYSFQRTDTLVPNEGVIVHIKREPAGQFCGLRAKTTSGSINYQHTGPAVVVSIDYSETLRLETILLGSTLNAFSITSQTVDFTNSCTFDYQMDLIARNDTESYDYTFHRISIPFYSATNKAIAYETVKQQVVASNNGSNAFGPTLGVTQTVISTFNLLRGILTNEIATHTETSSSTINLFDFWTTVYFPKRNSSDTTHKATKFFEYGFIYYVDLNGIQKALPMGFVGLTTLTNLLKVDYASSCNKKMAVVCSTPWSSLTETTDTTVAFSFDSPPDQYNISGFRIDHPVTGDANAFYPISITQKSF